MNSPFRTRLALAPTLAVTLGLFACGGEGAREGSSDGARDASGAQSAEDPQAEGAAPVRVMIPEMTYQGASVDGLGTLLARDPVSLSFSIGGTLVALSAEPGDRVRGGERLGQIDARELEAGLDQARAALEQAERDLARLERLVADRVVASVQVEGARTLVTIREAEVRALVARYTDVELRAPGAGVVLQRLADPGTRVQAGQPILVVATDAAGQIFRMGVSERDRMRLKLGDRAEVRLQSDAAGEGREARVTRLAEHAEPGTGTFVVELSIDGAPLPSGLSGRGRVFPSDERSALRVPAEALLRMEEGSGILFVVELDDPDPRVRRVRVEVVGLEGPDLLVRGSFAPNEGVVVEGGRWLRDGQPVRILP
jgi:RND family efflux transporter MFP subunit